MITNTKQQKLKIQSRVWNFKNTTLKKEKTKKKKKKKNKERKQTNQQKQCRKNYKENTGTKLISNTKKHKLKILSRVWNCRYTMLYKRRRERNRGKKKREKKSHRNYKKKNYMYKIDNIYQKAKIKNLE